MKRIVQVEGTGDVIKWRCDTCLKWVYIDGAQEAAHTVDDSPVCDLPDSILNQAWRVL